MPMIDVRDTRLYYETAGNGETALLFIHGMCGGGWNWEDQMDRLSPSFTCVAYDRRGHSRSEAGSENQSNRTHVDDAAALIQALGLDQPIIVGSSAGGAVAIELLLRYPDLASGAVVIEPPMFGLEPGSAEKLVNEMAPRLKNAVDAGGPRAAVDTFFETVCSDFWTQIDEVRRDRLRDNAPLLFATLEAQGTPITTSDLASIHHPVLVTGGEQSLPFARSIARKLAAGLPDARFIEFEDCGHVVYAEKPAEFAQAVLAFAKEIAPMRHANAAG